MGKNKPEEITEFCPICETPIAEWRPNGLILISGNIPRSMDIKCVCGVEYIWHPLTGAVETKRGRKLPRKEVILIKMKATIGKKENKFS